MRPELYFTTPNSSAQKKYEAMRAIFYNNMSVQQSAEQFNLSKNYIKKCKTEFTKALSKGEDPFFPPQKTGPKNPRTDRLIVDKIIALRKKNNAVTDIKAILDSQNYKTSYDTINKILKREGFAPLPKRTQQERVEASIPDIIEAPKSTTLEIKNEEFVTETGGGLLTFLPIIERMGIIKAIKKAKFPKTSKLSDVQSVLSFLALKLLGGNRWSYDCKWNMDRGMGMFAGLNVLPKATTLSTYSYRVSRDSNKILLSQLAKIFEASNEFNLDFKAIPHWGDESVLEKNWSGSKRKVMKSILALIVQDPETGFMSYTDTQIKHKNETAAIMEFVDFWKGGTEKQPKMLIFDSKLTTYQNMSKLNKDGIKFITLRRRGSKLIKEADALNWENVTIKRTKGGRQKIKVHDRRVRLRHYEGEVREIIITDHGRQKPTFLITNDIDADVKNIVQKYAKRWLVEKEISEQIDFFQLNQPSSSIVIKVDFDLTISLLAHNLYRLLAQKLTGFEACEAKTLHRKFIDNGARIQIKDKLAVIKLKKKTHMPIMFAGEWVNEGEEIKSKYLGINIKFMLHSST